MFLQAGQRLPLSNLIQDNLNFELRVRFQAPFEIDVSVFGLDLNDKLFNDDYMTFFNQPESPNGVVKFHRNGLENVFSFDLSRHNNQKVEKFVLCATVDHPTSTMKNIQAGQVEIVRNGKVQATFSITPDLFVAEKAVMLLQVYFKNVWRISAIGQGFNGGLPALVKHFGGDVEEPMTSTQPAPQPQVSTIDLRKKIVLDKVQSKNPHLVDLTKKSIISLEKNKILGLEARVGLVLDCSGSMFMQYAEGDVQKLIDRVLPLAVNFDDDGNFECWAFGEQTVRLNDVSLDNVKNYIETTDGGWEQWNIGHPYNYEPEAIEAVINHYSRFKNGIPTYIIFVSDGGIYEDLKISDLIRKSATLPIFWQFIGIGGQSYGILEELDSMEGRVIDNCNFFSLDKIDQYPDEKLYDLMLQEFPLWLKEAKQKNIVKG